MQDRTITLRLTISDPVAGVTYSLQDNKNLPVNAVVAANAPLSLDVPVQLAPDTKPRGKFVRREGTSRRFVYIAIGGQAGESGTRWDRRAKIDVHDIPCALLGEIGPHQVLECHLPGRAKDGGPACATVRPLHGWEIRDGV